MTYAVTVDVRLPESDPELDPLQREGVIFLLEKQLDSIESIEGPDGVEVEITDHLIAAHPGGALLKVFVDAPALEFAEDSVREVMAELLEQTELLADWEIARCEVELHPDEVQESLDAADGLEVPPADPAERARLHAGGRPAAPAGGISDEEVETMRRRLRSLAPRLQAFPPESFGYSGGPGKSQGFAVSGVSGVSGRAADRVVSREDAEIAAGALVYAVDILVDALFDDLAILEETGTSVAENDEEPFMVLGDLPGRFALQYTPLFARRLVVTAVAMTGRLAQPRFGRLSCVAEELLMRLLLTQAEVVADLHALHTAGVGAALEAFAARLYGDVDHEWLYRPAVDGPAFDDPALDGPAPAGAGKAPGPADPGIAPLGFEDWFTPFGEGWYVHPYAADEDEPEDEMEAEEQGAAGDEVG
ncbi:hypothetical protein [Actinacidiphila sp. ITFR-21]|uniref:hypothetical protein n=1 Tax=Actinacidiphila sp. ITFR-21 TaxID=3075199 RepID=UPI0028890E80|nr:hypothetical protein [Streptomyces sp. ITFR-21]WNI16830.1 hypothetical protein RLT57_15765 [Streptomyces sp. ITFR-21]